MAGGMEKWIDGFCDDDGNKHSVYYNIFQLFIFSIETIISKSKKLVFFYNKFPLSKLQRTHLFPFHLNKKSKKDKKKNEQDFIFQFSKKIKIVFPFFCVFFAFLSTTHTRKA